MFHGVGVEHNYIKFYKDRMATLAETAVELPETYASYQEFIQNNVFGEKEGEELQQDEVEQGAFMRRFRTEIKEARAQGKGKRANTPDDPE